MHFVKIDNTPWIDDAAKLLPFGLPRCFSDFMRSYEFSDFEIKHLHHYDNYDGNERWCWHVALKLDEAIFEICNRHRFLPIGQPDTGSYDRICLDLNRIKDGDCPVVQLDHEAILVNDKIEIVAELASSYRNLIEKVLTAYNALAPN